MKWVKQPYFAKAGTHRAGWKFWDLVNDKDTCLAFVRFRPSLELGYDTHATRALDIPAINHHQFTTLREAQGFCVAYFVAKHLEDE